MAGKVVTGLKAIARVRTNLNVWNYASRSDSLTGLFGIAARRSNRQRLTRLNLTAAERGLTGIGSQ